MKIKNKFNFFFWVSFVFGIPQVSYGLATVNFAEMIEKTRCMDSVVNISVTFTPEMSGPGEGLPEVSLPEGPFGEFFRDFFPFPFKERPSGSMTSAGSGFVIDPSGLIVTNYHVIAGADKGSKKQGKGVITVTFNSGEQLTATIVGADFRSDLALLKVTPQKPLPFLTFSSSSKARVGDPVLAVGNPFGLGGTVTAGIVSHTKRNLSKIGKEGRHMLGATHVEEWIQTDAAVNEGSSGGPLLNENGEVIAVNTAMFSRTGQHVGITLSIPSDVVSKIIDSLKKYGCIRRGWIGVKMGSPIDADIAGVLGMSQFNEGVMIDDVISGSPAEQAGLHSGDVLLKLGGTPVVHGSQIRSIVTASPPGASLTATIWRRKPKGNADVSIVVGELKNDHCLISPRTEKVTRSHNSVLGMTLKSLEDASERYYKGLDESIQKGVLVKSIHATSPAMDKLRPGDVILAIGMDPVETPRQCQSIIQQALKEGRKTALFLIARPSEGKMNILLHLDGRDTPS